ncbi:MAG: hypothetical protein KAS66_05400 [Candidatus Omnitrophica bacterium]|nr:hypothetical protein [Candidatus Omnitrophota bacterium]
MSEKIEVREWPQTSLSGGKRANIHVDGFDGPYDWFDGYGKDESCSFCGNWWDMICLARNILASENTKLVAPEYHNPEWANRNYNGEQPYVFIKPKDET